MIVDTSAIMAILLSEPEADAFFALISASIEPQCSAGSHVELSVVTLRHRPPLPGKVVDALLDSLRIEIVPVTFEQAKIARQAYLDYGRGNHPAGLNFGDCFAYALAKKTDKPLLYKGNDFVMTDIKAAAAGLA
jgi:ribonuclease VapC